MRNARSGARIGLFIASCPSPCSPPAIGPSVENKRPLGHLWGRPRSLFAIVCKYARVCRIWIAEQKRRRSETGLSTSDATFVAPDRLGPSSCSPLATLLTTGVSTARQGRSGLGLDAQREAIRLHLSAVGGELLGEHTEIESGRRSDRPELLTALAACRVHRATLVIAKLDRLARNVAFISALMDSGVEFLATYMPAANRLTLHIIAAVAENEARMISDRTKVALAAANQRGTSSGDFGDEPQPPSRGNNLKSGNRGASPSVEHPDDGKLRQARPSYWSRGSVARGSSCPHPHAVSHHRNPSTLAPKTAVGRSPLPCVICLAIRGKKSDLRFSPEV